MDTKRVLSILRTVENFPLEVILVKELILNGVDTEEKLVVLLYDDPLIPRYVKVRMENYFRDINNGFYDINKIPTIF